MTSTRNQKKFEKETRREEKRIVFDELFPTLSFATQKLGLQFSAKAIYTALDGLSARFTYLGAGSGNKITFDTAGVIAINGVAPIEFGKMSETLSKIISKAWIDNPGLNNFPPVHEDELDSFLPWLKVALHEQPYLVRNYHIRFVGNVFQVERDPMNLLWR
jgi:hypothetical protein